VTELLLLSNLTDADGLPAGEQVAEVTIYGNDAKAQQFILHKGVETDNWLSGCPNQEQQEAGCQISYSWHKRLAMVGRRAYEGAWHDQNASIFGTRLHYIESLTAQAVKIRYLADRGTLHIWGMAFEPEQR
jgi:hypothetical protein